MLAQYEQLLSRDQQTQVAQKAGAELASMEGLALGNILAQKFKGLFGEQLYHQVITQVSDELLDETVEHLTPKQLNRMIATLTSEIPLQIGKDKDPEFIPADDSVLKRLAQTRKGPEITRSIAHNIDARRMLLNPDTTIAQLPDHLLQRLRQPEWSAPVIASAAQQVADPQIQQQGQVDFASFNRMLAQYEQLLSRDQQTQVAQKAGAELASMEGLALGNILAQKFKGLFGEQLYHQVITQVSDELLDETVEHLTPKQLNRMIATLTSEIPLQIGKDKDPEFIPADDSVLKRLAQTRKGPEITRSIAHNIDARRMLLNPDTTLAQLPDHLLQRLKQPEWSAPVIASAAQQVADPQIQQQGQVDFASFNRMLAQYEQLLSRDQQTQVAQKAGAELASMEGLALGNILAQKFKGLFGEQLYHQVITQVSDELLDETVEHLTPKQLNRMIATLTSEIPLQIGKDKDPEFIPADDSVLKRLAQTRKGPEITRSIAHNIDARRMLLNPDTTLAQLPDHLLQRLKQPEWSAPVIASAAQQVADPQIQQQGQVDFASFNRMLAQYEQLLSRDQQTQVAQKAGAELASMEGLALGNILAQKFKGLFGEQLYHQVITQVSDELLDETVEHLTPKQLNRMIATLTSEIPLQIGKDKDPEFIPADDSVLKRLAQTRKGPEITRSIAHNIDARRMLLNPDTTLAQLPDHLLQRLKQPEWSAPVIASAAQQVADPQIQQQGQVDFASFNRMLAQYEQLLSRDQQTQVAQKAGAELASMEGLALGNILAQKFKGLFGEQLYHQVITQVSDQLLDETVEHLTPKQLNRMIATLTSEIPLQIGKDKDPEFIPADDSVLKRLAQTRKGPEITRSIAHNIDARRMLLNPDTTIAQLPDHLLQRLRQPEWSAPVIASAAQQVADPQIQQQGQVDFASFNRMLAQYEQLLSRDQQTQVAQKAGAELASMEGLALGNILAQKFKGLFGEQLYHQVITQVSDELLDETVEHLTPKQLNRMIATLTSEIPLQIGKDKDPEFIPADDSVLKRLAQTRKGPEITRSIAHNIDAHYIKAALEKVPSLPERMLVRLQQPAWSAPVLAAAMEQSTDPANFVQGKIDPSSIERILDRYDTLLNREKQLQVATQAGAQLASLPERELGLILVQKYKNLFGEQLYKQVINHLSDEKFERLVSRLKSVAEGKETLPLNMENKDIEEAYNRLVVTVRGEKMRAIIEMHRDQKRLKEKKQLSIMEEGLEGLLRGDLSILEKREFVQSLPELVRDHLNEGKEQTADSMLMQLAIALQSSNVFIRNNAALAIAAIAEQLAVSGQWQRLAKLMPALEQSLQTRGTNEQAINQTIFAIGSLAGHHITEEAYAQAWGTTHLLQTLTTGSNEALPHHKQIRSQAVETLKQLSSQPVLEQLLDRYLRSELHQEEAGKLLVEMGKQSAQFQLQQLMSNESRFERKKLLSLIQQTGNPAVSILMEQLHKDSPWYVVRNIIRLLGEIGNTNVFPSIQPFISHPDLRVQQEVINSAIKIGGEDLKDFLLHALQNVADPLKIRVVNHIAVTFDERFVRPLTDLLESTKPFLGKNKNDLLLAICRTLGIMGAKRATASLNRVAQSKNVLGLGGFSDEVRLAAEQALAQIKDVSLTQKEKAIPEEYGQEASEEKDEGQTDAPVLEQQSAEERAIFSLAARGLRDQAIKRLVDLISTTAYAGDFRTAERLRERIYEIDSLALGEIIRSGEIIEQAKRGAIREEDLEIWSDLTDKLSSEEFQTIYHEFIERRFKPEEPIVSQGDRNDELFFINQGSVKVSHMAGPRELFITSLSRGQIAGENFFTPSFWTVTMTSLTSTRIYVLQQSALDSWKDRFPGLRIKLHEFYAASNNIHSMLEKKGLERRQDQRFKLSRKIQVQPINNFDAPIGRGFRAETADISLGGLAFLIRISKQEHARLLLGRKMQVVLPVGGEAQQLQLKGLVIGVQPSHILHNDFSVHFKFDDPLEQPQLQTILG